MRLTASTSLRDRLLVATFACALAGTGLLAAATPVWAEENTPEPVTQEETYGEPAEVDLYDAEQDGQDGDQAPAYEWTAGSLTADYLNNADNGLVVEDFQAPAATWVYREAVTNPSSATALTTALTDRLAAQGLTLLSTAPQLESLAYQRAAECSVLPSDLRPDGTFFTTVGGDGRVTAEIVVRCAGDGSADQGAAAADQVALAYADLVNSGSYTAMGCAAVTVDDATCWVILFASDGIVAEDDFQATDGATVGYWFAVADGNVALGEVAGEVAVQVGEAVTVSVPATLQGDVSYAGTWYGATFLETGVPLANGTFTWNLSNTVYASVDENGTVTGLANGSCTLSLTSSVWGTRTVSVVVGTGVGDDVVDLAACTVVGIAGEVPAGTTPSFSVVTPDNTVIDPVNYTVEVAGNDEPGALATLTVTAKDESAAVSGQASTTFLVGANEDEANYDDQVATLELGDGDYAVPAGEEAGDGEDEADAEPAAATSLEAADVSGVADATYTGAAQTPAPVVTLGGQTLVEGTDYTVAYDNNVNAGQASVTVTGIGTYSGSRTVTFTIEPQSIAGTFSVGQIPSQAYTGQALTPAVTVSDGQKTLAVGTECTVTYEQNVNAGSAHVVVKGTGNYTGTVDGSFVIAPLNIQRATVTMPNMVYTGQPLSPLPVSVTIGDLALQEGTDYTVVGYGNNTNVGSAKATLQGKGNYVGTVSVDWKIVAQGTANAGTTQTLPQTGDATNVVPVVVGAVVGVALVAVAVALIVRSRSSKKSAR
jgi:LPXTG-motif cell wall-anchored protein